MLKWLQQNQFEDYNILDEIFAEATATGNYVKASTKLSVEQLPESEDEDGLKEVEVSSDRDIDSCVVRGGGWIQSVETVTSAPRTPVSPAKLFPCCFVWFMVDSINVRFIGGRLDSFLKINEN